jgi:hypothetical protein
MKSPQQKTRTVMAVDTAGTCGVHAVMRWHMEQRRAWGSEYGKMLHQ